MRWSGGLCKANPEWSLGQANLEAVVLVEREMVRRIEARESFLVETVLSSDKYLRHVERARELGFLIGMIYVGLHDVETSIARVAHRVERGGHDVPENKLRDVGSGRSTI